MPAVSQKNLPLSPAATSLGLGDVLLNQVADAEEENRRRMLTDQGVGLSPSAATLLGPLAR